MSALDKIIREEARLIMLKELSTQPDYALGETLLQSVLSIFAISKSREWVREEMRRLADLGAVTLVEAGSILIARLTPKGQDHVEGRLVIEGVKRPAPKE